MAVASLGAPSAGAATVTWVGGGGGAFWGVPANWGGALPTLADDAYIAANTVQLDGMREAGSLLVGDTAAGALVFRTGASLTTGSFVLGNDGGSNGAAVLGGVGAGNIWNSMYGTIAKGPNSTGSVTVSDPGSRLEVLSTLYVGELGTATLAINNGGVVQAGVLAAGRGGDGWGEIQVADAGSTLQAGILLVGGDEFGQPSTSARGTVRVLAGATLIATEISIGDSALSTGSLLVDGEISSLDSALPVKVGNFGSGLFEVNHAGRVLSGGLIAADKAGSSGSVLLTGADSSWTSSGPVEIGKEGSGTLLIADGATLSGTSGFVGVGSGSVSTASIGGTGSSWSNTGIFVVGDARGARGGLGISGGGQLTSWNGTLGRRAGSYGNVTISGDGSKWTSTGPVTVGDAGEGRLLLMFGGALNASEVVIANAAGSKGTLVMGTPADFGAAPVGVLNAPVLRFGAGDGELLFNFVGPALTYGGSIQGNGRVNILSGDVILTGNSSNTGLTTVSGSALTVNGALAGPVSVGAGATLGGAGSVGAVTLAAGSVLSPGNSIGTLTVNGDLTFAPGSTYRVEAAPASADSDRVVVNGIARLAGSVLHVGPDGNFTPNLSYTILSANSVQGRFESVSSNYAFLDPQLAYSATDVKLGLLQTRAFPTGANTPNQRAVAGALESMGPDSALRQYVATLAVGQTEDAFDSLSGEIHASVSSTLLQSAAQVRQTPLAKLRANLQATARAGSPTAAAGVSDAPLSASEMPASGALPAWAEVVGNWQTIDADGNAAQIRQHVGGLFVGADRPVGAGWRVGGALGYTDSKARVDERASQADVSSYSALVYGGKSFAAGPGAWQFLAGAGYTWHDISTRRYANSQTAALTADYGASTAQVFTELSYARSLGERTTLEPFVGLAWSDLRTRGFAESGGGAALSGESGSTQQTYTTLGLRAAQGFEAGGRQGKVFGSVGWRHVFGDIKPESVLAFGAGQSFTVAGAPIGRDAALVELGAEVAIARTASLRLGYAGQYASDSREHSVNANVRWQF
ncbi:autotransporter domain-containing protein [Achromobacter marplatensis]|uniref:autotransporter family protein n=1 Tax=Achromobacter marplatensis TaxID=470868 RepID=UPI0039F71DC0